MWLHQPITAHNSQDIKKKSVFHFIVLYSSLKVRARAVTLAITQITYSSYTSQLLVITFRALKKEKGLFTFRSLKRPKGLRCRKKMLPILAELDVEDICSEQRFALLHFGTVHYDTAAGPHDHIIG